MSKQFQYSTDGGATWEWSSPEGVIPHPGKSFEIRYLGKPIVTHESNRAPAAPDSPPSHWDEWAMQKARAFVRRTEEVNHPRSMLVSAIHCALVEAMEFANRAAPVPASTGRIVWANFDGMLTNFLCAATREKREEFRAALLAAIQAKIEVGIADAARELDADALDKAGDAWGDKVIAEEKRVPHWGEAFDAGAKWAATRATAESAPASAAPPELPAILFDGHAVYKEVLTTSPNPPRTSPHNVAEVLDAVVRLMRAPSNSPVGAKEQE